MVVYVILTGRIGFTSVFLSIVVHKGIDLYDVFSTVRFVSMCSLALHRFYSLFGSVMSRYFACDDLSLNSI